MRDPYVVPTVKIVETKHPAGFVIINRDDFDPAVHVEHNDTKPVAKTEKKKSR